MQVGDLVVYFNSAYPSKEVGIVVEVLRDKDIWDVSPYRVRWANHPESIREWYGEDEIKKVADR